MPVRSLSRKAAKCVRETDAVEYQRQFALFVASTDEKPKQIETLRKIVAGLKRRRSFLDVGAGSGEITAAVSESFAETTVVEPNPGLVRRLSTLYPNFRIFPEPWGKADLGRDRFDFILCSHVLGYLPERQWLGAVERMVGCLRPGGKLAVVLHSPEGGVAGMFRKMTGATVNSVKLWSDLVRTYGDERVRPHYGFSAIHTETLEDMTAIGLFLLSDPRYLGRKRELRRYLEKRHKETDGYFLEQEYMTLEVTQS
ncbi:MAG: class I SAM-dependent methyltransferase [Candidatus Omnitrophota bacterium]|jgi:SAM-dependent methyltransferase